MASVAKLGVVRRTEDPSVRSAPNPDNHEGGAILRHLADFIDAFMWQADPATLSINFVTTSVRDLLGHPVSRWMGAPKIWGANIHPRDRGRVVHCLRATGLDGADREVEFRAEHADGRTRMLRLAVRLVSPPSGSNELWGITTDITNDARVAETLRDARERYRALSAQAAKFRRQALEDPLTKLPNRVLFDDRSGAALRNAERTGEPLAILLMDLDRFKEVNDTRGHQAGDVVLREVALRIRICLRAQDTPARLGGDEFAALLPNVDEEGAVRVASRITRAMQAPFDVDGTPCTIGVSIGIALFPGHGRKVEELLAKADVAMYRAKEGGCGYVLATETGEMPPVAGRRRNRRRGMRRLVIGVAASLALLAGALSPTGHQRPHQSRSASRLDAASVALQAASGDEVDDVVAGAERALAEIQWKDVAGTDVAKALDHLRRILTGIKSGLPATLGARVDGLLATILDAQLLGHIAAPSKSIASVVPKIEPKRAASPPALTATSAPVPAPGPVAPIQVPIRP